MQTMCKGLWQQAALRMDSPKLLLSCLVMFAILRGICGSNCSDLVTEANECFTSRGLPAPPTALNLPYNKYSLIGLTGKFRDSVCTEEQGQFTAALRCTFQVNKDCLPNFAHPMPSPEQAEAFVKYDCEQLDRGIDTECIYLQMRNLSLAQCVNDGIANIFGEDPGLNEVQCGFLDMFVLCHTPAFQNCGCAEVDYVATLFIGSLRPEVCGPPIIDPVSCDGDNGGTVFSVRSYMLSLSLIPVMFRFYMA